MEMIRTERLVLREFEMKDAVGLFMLNADPAVLRYTGDHPFSSIADAEKLISTYTCYRTDGFGRYSMVRVPDGAFLGWCGLRKQANGVVDLGYRLQHCYRGKGYATEAGLASVEFGFEEFGLTNIIGRVSRKNVASIRVLEKCGFRYVKEEAAPGIPEALVYQVERP
jgi:[ribosomal protein S5]-alanine N-acetyltransferase